MAAPSHHRQQGATLIIVLVFMVILTAVSLSSMHSSSFEIKVARSVKSQVDALTAAEDALANGESFVNTLTDISAFPTGAGFYQGASLAGISGLNALINTGQAASTSFGSGEYHIEYLGKITLGGNSANFGNAGLGSRHLFRITGVGRLAGGQTKITQSYFAITD